MTVGVEVFYVEFPNWGLNPKPVQKFNLLVHRMILSWFMHLPGIISRNPELPVADQP